jgi:hypothetical protein
LVACAGSWQAEKDQPDLPKQDVTDSGTAIHAALESGDSSELQESDAEVAERLAALEKRALEEWMTTNGIDAAPVRHAEERVWARNPKTLELLFSAQLDVYYIHEQFALVLDFKSGYLNPTPAESNWQVAAQCICLVCENKQLRHFTAGIAASRLTSKLDLTIYEPQSLQNAEIEIRRAIWKASQPTPPRYPGEHCRYCKAKGVCPEAAAYSSVILHNGLVPKLNKLGIVEAVGQMTPMQLSWVFQRSKIASQIFDACEDRLKAMPEDQLAAVGLKLKPGAVQRKIANVGSAIEKLQSTTGVTDDMVYDCLSLSVSKAEDMVGKALDIPKKNRRDKINEVLAGLITEKQNSPSLQTID